MSNFFGDPFEGPNRQRTIDLSTSTSTSSSALLSSVRAERLARQEKKKHEQSALVIQKTWRGRKEDKTVREGVLSDLEAGRVAWERQAERLCFLLRDGWTMGSKEEVKRKRAVLIAWARAGLERPDGIVGAMATMEGFAYRLGAVSRQMLGAIAYDPTSSDSMALFNALAQVFDPTTWSSVSATSREQVKLEILENVARGGYIETLVTALEKLKAASLPKKKHPHLVPLTPLLTAPIAFVQQCPVSIYEGLLHTLLAVPALPTSLPLPSLTHLSNRLPLFTTLLPLWGQQPELLNTGRLATEEGKTYFLGNLVTFGVTGGMLARYGLKGASDWIKVIGTVLKGTNVGWGKWADGILEEEDDVKPMTKPVDSDEDEPMPLAGPSRSVRRAPRRAPLPANIQKRVASLASQAHLHALADTLLTPSAPGSAMTAFAEFAMTLLNAFRGTPKWESILEALMNGTRGKALEKRVWREGVRGRWTHSGDRSGWDTFTENPSTPCLLFLTHLYNHYLLITPDHEFFDTANHNPFSLDEVLEMAGIWRDLAYYAYTNGVAPEGTRPIKGVGTEEERALLTRGVTRVAERNARRKFANENFWVMVHDDLKSFVEVAVLEDANLTQMDEEPEVDANQLPRWARARQKFSKRQLAYVSPRLGLLNNLPMTVPFMTRLEIFRNFIYQDESRMYHGSGVRRIKAKIRRDHLAEDGFDQLSDYGPALKGPIYIKFYDRFGDREAGIDGGGLFKEFLTSLSKDVFDTNRGLWLATDENQLYPNPHSYAIESYQLRWYAFIGRILGKALYEGILVDVSFADFFLAKWLGRQSYLDDLNSLDKDLYKGLIMLKNYEKVEELSLNFTVDVQEFGVTKTIDLIPNGSDIPVTANNRNEYIQLVCRYKLDRQISAQSRAFFSGLSDIIDPKWLRMFDQQELRQLVGGEETMIDIEDLRANCESSGFKDEETMRMFWKVVKGFSQDERQALLRFVTSCSRPPLLGFSQLNPKFGVRCAGTDTTRLPSASSCFNLLKLPEYKDEASLKSKLLQAITSGAGFDLS